MLVTCSLVFQPPPCPSPHSESRGDTNTGLVILAMAYEAVCDLAWYPCDLRDPPRPPTPHPLNGSQLGLPGVVRLTEHVLISLAGFTSAALSGRNSLLLGFPTVSVQVLPISCPDSPRCMEWNHHRHWYLATALCSPRLCRIFLCYTENHTALSVFCLFCCRISPQRQGLSLFVHPQHRKHFTPGNRYMIHSCWMKNV